MLDKVLDKAAGAIIMVFSIAFFRLGFTLFFGGSR